MATHDYPLNTSTHTTTPLMRFLQEEFARLNAELDDIMFRRAPGTPLRTALPDDTFWRRYDDFAVTHVTPEGDLLFDIRDLFTPHGFWNGNIIQAWANAQSFNIDDIDGRDALWILLQDTLLPAIRELPNGTPLAETFQDVLRGVPVPDLPELRIVVNGSLAVKRIIEHFDGPFDSDDAYTHALERRCGETAARLRAAPDDDVRF